MTPPGDLDRTDDEILEALQAAELESLPASEWGAALVRKVLAVEADNARLRAENAQLRADLAPLTLAAAVARRAAKRAWVALGSSGVGLVGLAVMLWGLSGSRGEARGDARAERARLAADHAALVELAHDLDVLERAHAELVGLVSGLYPFRSLPVYGPSPTPIPE